MLKLLALLMAALVIFTIPVYAEDQQMSTIYFAGGCFWGVEKLMALVEGVQDVQSGYAQGTLDNPRYEDVMTGATGHRETVKVVYDPEVIGLKDLLRLFFATIDPTVENRQAYDIGTQYQTGVYWEQEEDQAVVEAAALAERERHAAFHVELQPLTSFWPAEEYHQDYLDKNPTGYCHIGPQHFEMARELKKED